MPEEQAFCVLVRLMYDYKLRDLYKDGFEILKLKLYQLDRLLEVIWIFVLQCSQRTYEEDTLCCHINLHFRYNE